MPRLEPPESKDKAAIAEDVGDGYLLRKRNVGYRCEEPPKELRDDGLRNFNLSFDEVNEFRSQYEHHEHLTSIFLRA
ncbi:hypothetical protein NPIL_242541 [Nephila pilipes]|uniref:Uncharacterized protein n=1 Tax=Nephila pilipes TaxID=299642 RepID=A0A8X6K490_NEPPI|nr:hypothetical protein NPIL_242541 [Nephila pilipes]